MLTTRCSIIFPFLFISCLHIAKIVCFTRLTIRLRNFRAIDAEETDDLAFDASASDVKSALETLTNVGTVDVTRDDLGNDLYAWSITFTEPATSAYVATVDIVENGDTNVTSTELSFPLLYAGGAESDAGLGLETLGAGGEINVTRIRRGTLGPLSGQVNVHLSTD